jgi:hypothetical protein
MGTPGDDAWYGERNGRAEGPHGTEALLARLRQDAATWRVWKPGMAGWQPADAVFGSDAVRGPSPQPPADPVAPAVPDAPVTPAAAVAAAADGVAPGPGRRRRYLGRHWRGELGLGVSYWLNTVLLGIALALLGFLLARSGILARPPPAAVALTLTALVPLGIVITLWQAIGTWRSARRHVLRGGRRVWAVAAKVMVAVGLVRFAVVLGTQEIPTARNAWTHVALLAGLPAPTAHSLRRGTEVAFAGGIRRGAADILRHGLDAAPTARVLHLDSPGGDLAESMAMAELVRQRSLTTYVRGQCLSACTAVFQAGRTRVLRDGAALGFHRPWTVAVAGDVVRAIMQAERARLAAARVPAWFIDRVMATPPNALWFPTDEELSKAGILSHRVDGEGYSPGRPQVPLQPADMAGILRDRPMAAALEQVDAAAFDGLLRAVLELARDGGTRGEMIDAVQRAALPRYAAGLRVAPDAELVALVQAALPAAEALARHDPPRCQDWLFVRQSRPLPDVTRILGTEEVAALEAAAAATMRFAADPTAGVAPPDAAQVQEPLQAVYQALAVRLGPVQSPASRNLDRQRRDAAQMCWTTIRLFREILRLPAAEVAPMLRHTLARRQGGSP